MQKVTAEILRQKSACETGVAEFEAAYPEGLDLPQNAEEQIALFRTCPVVRRYWGWAVDRGIVPGWSMSGADLRGVDLRGVDLRGATN